jgi:hypothetical protein
MIGKLNKTDRILLLAIVILLILAVGTALLGRHATNIVRSYKECADAGNPIQLSYPSVCVTRDGHRYTNPDEFVSPPKYYQYR